MAPPAATQEPAGDDAALSSQSPNTCWHSEMSALRMDTSPVRLVASIKWQLTLPGCQATEVTEDSCFLRITLLTHLQSDSVEHHCISQQARKARPDSRSIGATSSTKVKPGEGKAWEEDEARRKQVPAHQLFSLS